MEISEIVSYFLNTDTNMLEVSFRTIEDSEDVVRTDDIEVSIAEEYGFDLVVDNFNFFDDELDDDLELEDNKIELDEDELISFLNEYYIVYPELLPKPELF